MITRTILAPVVGLALAGLVALACDAGAGINYVNETDLPLSIYNGDSRKDFAVSLPPRASTEVATAKFQWKDVMVIRDDAGKSLFREEINWDELERRGFKYVITDQMIGLRASTPAPSY